LLAGLFERLQELQIKREHPDLQLDQVQQPKIPKPDPDKSYNPRTNLVHLPTRTGLRVSRSQTEGQGSSSMAECQESMSLDEEQRSRSKENSQESSLQSQGPVLTQNNEGQSSSYINEGKRSSLNIEGQSSVSETQGHRASTDEKHKSDRSEKVKDTIEEHSSEVCDIECEMSFAMETDSHKSKSPEKSRDKNPTEQTGSDSNQSKPIKADDVGKTTTVTKTGETEMLAGDVKMRVQNSIIDTEKNSRTLNERNYVAKLVEFDDEPTVGETGNHDNQEVPESKPG